MDYIPILAIFDSAVRLAAPLLLASLAGLFSERAGIFDIGLEGKILVSAMLAASVATFTGSVWAGLLAGLMGSLVFSAMHGLASITFRGNQLISGVALNFLASGSLPACQWSGAVCGRIRQFPEIPAACHSRSKPRPPPRPDGPAPSQGSARRAPARCRHAPGQGRVRPQRSLT